VPSWIQVTQNGIPCHMDILNFLCGCKAAAQPNSSSYPWALNTDLIAGDAVRFGNNITLASILPSLDPAAARRTTPGSSSRLQASALAPLECKQRRFMTQA
jgi:hypothetical protein